MLDREAKAEIERLQEKATEDIAEIAKLLAESGRLRAALKPFADAADTLSSFPDDTSLDLAPITLGNLRTARRVLAGEKE